MTTCAMFGKLPSKRDFVSYNMPRPFLDHWEEWLQASVAASRHTLGNRWQEIFLSVPVWHFWLGPRVYGTAVTGALMPSVDGVGRYFPLSVCACEPSGMYLAPPPSPGLDQWHRDCERFLLHMLEDNIEREPAEILDTFPFPLVAPRLRADTSQRGGLTVWTGESSADATLQAMRMLDDDAANATRCLWWTDGGSGYQAQVVAIDGRPSPQLFEYLMTGAMVQ